MNLAGRPWLQTFSGRAWCADAPFEYDYDIREIAHALSHINRFAGHTRQPYSVAQHSVHVAELVADRVIAGTLEGGLGMILGALLHDAAEAFMQDLPSPIKRMPEMSLYCEAIRRTELAILGQFGLHASHEHEAIKLADLEMLAAERRDLLGDALAEHWQWLPKAPSKRVEPVSPAFAKGAFLEAWERYGGEL